MWRGRATQLSTVNTQNHKTMIKSLFSKQLKFRVVYFTSIDTKSLGNLPDWKISEAHLHGCQTGIYLGFSQSLHWISPCCFVVHTSNWALHRGSLLCVLGRGSNSWQFPYRLHLVLAHCSFCSILLLMQPQS